MIGAPWLAESVTLAGLVPVRLATDEPVAVVQGHSPETGWRTLAEACIALRTGADWVACNVDSTLPTDRGLLPGNGAMVAALIAATGLQPRVAGKPARPLLDAAIRLVDAQRPLVVGDRLDTDIACAVAAGCAEPAGLHRCLHRAPTCWPRCPNSDRPTWRSTCADSSRRITPSASRRRRRRVAAWNGRSPSTPARWCSRLRPGSDNDDLAFPTPARCAHWPC